MKIARPLTALAILTAFSSFPVALSWGQTDDAATTRQPPALTYVWAAKVEKSPFIAPNRPIWRLKDILKSHAGQKNWTQLVMRDSDGLSGSYIQMAPGEKTKTQFFVDSSIFWIVQAGQIRFNIQGQAPFIATKGFVVQVPQRIPYSMETVGDEPSLRFEVSHTRARPMYPIDETPTPIKGYKYIRVALTGPVPDYGKTRPYLDFQKEIVEGGGKAPAGFVRDAETTANIIRGPAVPRPPDSDPGHFHDGTSEFWFILEGHLSLLVEGEPFIDSAEQGDIMYAPPGRWHRTSFAGTGMGTRISIHAIPVAPSILDPDHSSQAQ